MATLNDRIEELERLVNELREKIKQLSKDTEEGDASPHTKGANTNQLANFDAVLINGKWKVYAIYKD